MKTILFKINVVRFDGCDDDSKTCNYMFTCIYLSRGMSTTHLPVIKPPSRVIPDRRRTYVIIRYKIHIYLDSRDEKKRRYLGRIFKNKTKR